MKQTINKNKNYNKNKNKNKKKIIKIIKMTYNKTSPKKYLMNREVKLLIVF